MPIRGKQFEYELTKSLNAAIEQCGRRAIAYRHFVFRMQPQYFDIYVDTREPQLYLAIECKSLDYDRHKSLNFMSHFKHAGPKHQIEAENEFLFKSGRKGILAVYLHNIKGDKARCVFVPWSTLITYWIEDKHSLDLKDYNDYYNVQRYKERFTIDLEELMAMDSGLIRDED